jgi:predicted nucleic acid-binding protein
MAANVVVDAGYLVALLSRRDRHHEWAKGQALVLPPPWRTCEAVLSETFHLLRSHGVGPLAALLRRGSLAPVFASAPDLERLLGLMERYADLPMSFADACLVRMSETLTDPILLTTDADFRVYRRHGRQVIPVRMPAV